MNIQTVAQNPVAFINDLVPMLDINGELITPSLSDDLADMVTNFNEHTIVNVTHKRRCGVTSATMAYLLWLITFNQNMNIALVSTKLDESKRSLCILKQYQSELPEWCTLPIKKNNKTEIQLINNSRISVCSSNPTALIGRSLNLIVLDQISHLSLTKQDDLYQVIMPHLCANPKRKIVVLTSGEGADGPFTNMNKSHQVIIDGQSKQ